MKKSTGIVSLVLTVAVTAGLLALAAVGVGENKTGAAKNIPLGLDLAGGVSITYQAKGDTPSAEEMNDTIYKLQKRVEGHRYTSRATTESTSRFRASPTPMQFWKNLENLVLYPSRICPVMSYCPERILRLQKQRLTRTT